MEKKYQICTRGLWDTTVPGIEFDHKGVCNYAIMFDKLCSEYPRGEEGSKKWLEVVDCMKKKARKQRYDCIIGVSGGTDSSYLLHIVKKEFHLNPLAVNLDNGWNSDIAVKNIKKITSALNIDLETYVIDYQEIKDLMRSYMLASLPWIDIPTDLAIKSVLFSIAAREDIGFILRANDFRSEGTQPREWTYGDGRQIRHVHSRFGKVKLRTYPNYTISKLVHFATIKGIKNYFPFYYLDYNKKNAQEFLAKQYGWQYYGGHHYENIFTKFAITYWLYKKFNIDKRKITLSAQILSGEITRAQGIKMLQQKPFDDNMIDQEVEYVIKKLGIARKKFEEILALPNQSFQDYPSYYGIMTRLSRFLFPLLNMFYPYKPMSLYQMEMRSK